MHCPSRAKPTHILYLSMMPIMLAQAFQAYLFLANSMLIYKDYSLASISSTNLVSCSENLLSMTNRNAANSLSHSLNTMHCFLSFLSFVHLLKELRAMDACAGVRIL